MAYLGLITLDYSLTQIQGETYRFAKLSESLLSLNFSDFGEIFLKAPTLLSRKYEPLFDPGSSFLYLFYDSRLHYATLTKPQFFYSSAHNDRNDSLIMATSSALLSERATAKPGVSISDDLSSITVSELVAIVLVTNANHVAVGVYETHYSIAGSATRLNSMPRLAKYEDDLSIPKVTYRFLEFM